MIMLNIFTDEVGLVQHNFPTPYYRICNYTLFLYDGFDTFMLTHTRPPGTACLVHATVRLQ